MTRFLFQESAVAEEEEEEEKDEEVEKEERKIGRESGNLHIYNLGMFTFMLEEQLNSN